MSLAFFSIKKPVERRLGNVTFNVYKLNHRPKPKKIDRIKIISCFSEFGCETFGVLYCIPRLLKRFPGSYVIAMGWYGREYLYRHLVDEYWEIKEEHMWLREHTRAFHHVSWNLRKIEESATIYGQVIPSSSLGKYAVANFCRTCGMFWQDWKRRADACPKCKSTVIIRSMLTDIDEYRKSACKVPRPSQEMLDWADTVVKPNTVGIFARNRKTYGRNLSPDFYVKLIELLRGMGYNIIWLGEPQSTRPCPVDQVLDFSRMAESQELERTLAIICKLSFTIQFWTASSRLSGMMGVPFLLFESPEQIFPSYSGLCGAQEGRRLDLTSFGPKKIVLAHYKSVLDDPEKALETAYQAIKEMQIGNYDYMFGMVQDEWFTNILMEENKEMLKINV